MKVTQDSNVSVAAIKQLAQNSDNIHIHIHQNAVQISNHSGPNVKAPEWVDVPVMDEQALFSLIQSLPEPRLDNLVSLAYMVALKTFGGNKTHAAKWLGVSARNYHNRKSMYDGRLEKQKLLVEKIGE